MFIALLIYTAQVIAHHGWDLLPTFFGDIARMGWPGQFNFDFMCMLSLSALWVAWRHRFSGAGMALGLLALVGGSLFLSAYLLIESLRAKGDTHVLLLGAERAGRGATGRV
ncbi:MAG: hypothetical protein HZY79_11815 [Rhodoblastus sp.]|nr:MAG: hypothetical protein HZY79_11815 [Rhodoblastus sp.]